MTPPVLPTEPCLAHDYSIRHLPLERLPNIRYSPAQYRDSSYRQDRDGVILTLIGGNEIYHPVAICKKAFSFLTAYRDEGEEKWLTLARHHADRLIKEAVLHDSAAYFPYNFDHLVNQQPGCTLKAPWYSGMAQGEGLSVMVRTFLATGDSAYLAFAHKVFRSLTRLKGESYPWVAFRDQRGCYWIEEYPVEPPSMTLNGFMAAIFGIYDYYELTRNSRAEEVLRESFDTVRNYMGLFRRPGAPSYYGLRLGHYSAPYHGLHIQQLQFLARMSGDSVFRDWADSLKKDFTQERP